MTDDSLYKPVGNGTDVSLFKWLQDADIPVHDIIQHKYTQFGEIKRLSSEYPFDTRQKRATTQMLIDSAENATQARVYVKGAPEEILKMCSKHFHAGGNGEDVPMTSHDKDLFKDYVVKMGKKGMRAIAFAYKDSDSVIEKREDAEKDLTFIMGVFLEDPLREKIPEIMQFIKYGKTFEQLKQDKEDSIVTPTHVNIRLVSGDSFETAKFKAIEAGILEKPDGLHGRNYAAEANDNDFYEGKVMTAEDFKIAIGGVEEVRDENDQGNEDDQNAKIGLQAKDMDKFTEVMKELVVVAMADPDDKRLIANSLQREGSKVVVVGDGLNDVNAIYDADVGFAMGDAKQLAKAAAKMILKENQFYSLARAIMWGRNIYTNVRRFVQFQFACNLTTLITVFMGYCFFGESPINAIQLLWINLIMDTLAALALATTPPFTNIMKEGPCKSESSIITPSVWRQIYAMTLWNIIIMAIVIFAGKGMYGLQYEKTDDILNGDTDIDDIIVIDENAEVDDVPIYTAECLEAENCGPLGKKKHYSLIFQTFVFLQFFNFINCRMVGPKDFNVFTRFGSNWTFVIILLIIIAVQWLSQTSVLSWLLITSDKMTPKEFWSCVVWGSTALLGSIFSKLTPESWLLKIPSKMQLSES